MEPEFDALLRTLTGYGQWVESLRALRDELVCAIRAHANATAGFALPELPSDLSEAELDARVALVRLLVLDDATVRVAGSVALADRLYRIGVPRDVSDHEAPGQWAMLSILLIHASDSRTALRWAQQIVGRLEGEPRPADAALLGLRLAENELVAIEVFANKVEPRPDGGIRVQRLVSAARTVRMLRDSPRDAPYAPEAVGVLGARFMRGLRRQAARLAGLSIKTEEHVVALPEWLRWRADDPPPGGLVAAAIEWLSAATRSQLAHLSALETAAATVEALVSRSNSRRFDELIGAERRVLDQNRQG